MALSNYTELQASVATWMNRSDLNTQIVDFISIGESNIATDIRMREMLASANLVTLPLADTVALPTGWLEFKSVSIAGKPIEYVMPEKLRRDKVLNTGVASNYSIEGLNLLINGTQSAAQTINTQYYKCLDALRVTSTNFLLTQYPQVYLYAALAQAALFMIDDPRAATWESAYKSAVAKAMASNGKALISGGSLRIRN